MSEKNGGLTATERTKRKLAHFLKRHIIELKSWISSKHYA